MAQDNARPSQPTCAACALRQRPAFLPKSQKEIEWTQQLKQGQIRLPAGADLLRANDASGELYTLYSGWAFRHRTLLDGRRQILNFFLPGDFIGFQASMSGPIENSVEALTSVELCVFPRANVWRIFQDMPELAFQLSWLGAREEGMVDDQLTAVGQMSAAERMASMIVGLYKRAKSLELVDDESFEFPLRREHIADALGLSLVHTIKTWSALRKTGLFEQRGQRLRLLDPRINARLASLFERAGRQRPIL